MCRIVTFYRTHSKWCSSSTSEGSEEPCTLRTNSSQIFHQKWSVLTVWTFRGVLRSGLLMSTTNFSLVHALSTFSFCISKVVFQIIVFSAYDRHQYTIICTTHTQSRTARSILASKVAFSKVITFGKVDQKGMVERFNPICVLAL